MIGIHEDRKCIDCNTQTDFTLSDIDNFETYKEWYVTESWTAFAQFAKFRKDILKIVKDDYIGKIKHKKPRARNPKSSISTTIIKRFKNTETSEIPILQKKISPRPSKMLNSSSMTSSATMPDPTHPSQIPLTK